MIKHAFIFIISMLILQHSSAQNSFEQIYGGELPDFFHAAVATSDGGLLAGGSTRSYGNGNLLNTDFYLVKTNADGDTLWTRVFGTASNDDGIAVAEFANGYVMAGTSINPTNGSSDFYLVKTDQNGNTEWDYYYGGSGSEFCIDIMPLSDSSLLVYGTSTSYTNGGYDLYLFKVDASGSQTDASHFGGTGNDAAYGFRRTQDGGYILSGFSTSGLATGDIYLARIDSSLTFQWSRTFGGSGFDIGYDVEQTDDGGYLVLGLWQNGADSSEIALIQTDTDGLNAVMSYPGTHPGDYGYKLAKEDDGFLISGFTNTPGKGSEVLLIETDVSGDTLWSRHFGGAKNEVAFWISTFPGGDIVLAGETEGFGIDNFDAYLLRLNADGDIPCPGSVSFSADNTSLCEDGSVFFTNTTVSSQEFEWKMNSNLFSNDINASYYFDEAGSYHAELSACTVSETDIVEIFSKPPTHFTYTVSGTTVSFNLDPGITPSSIMWNFGDGTAVNTVDFNPVHAYANPGGYWIILSVTNSDGCDSTYIEQINLVTGVDDPNKGPISITVLSNPLHGSGEIVVQEEVQFPLTATITDVRGREMSRFEVSQAKQRFSVENLQAGMYFLVLIRKEGNLSAAKLIVQ